MLNDISMLATIYWKQQQAAKLSIIILIANIEPIIDICNCNLRGYQFKHKSLFKSRDVWIRGKVKCNKIRNFKKRSKLNNNRINL